MRGRNGNSGRSGQALIITSLIITLLFLSTAYYVFETGQRVGENEKTVLSIFSATRVGTINTVISALANVSNGGERAVLTLDLSRLSSAIRDHFYDSQCTLGFTPLNSSPYQDGTWLSWESSEIGVSSAYVNFLLNFSGPSLVYWSEYETNVTTVLTIEGTYTGDTAQKSANVTCRIFNENQPALATSITLFYQNETGGSWSAVDSSHALNTTDYGNGTHFFSFNVITEDILQVSAQVRDLRGVFVMANATCTGI
jgi:hypothetical protein